MSDSEMETDQDMYPDPQEDKENNNTANGKPLDNIARKESYMRLLNKIEEIQESDDVGLHVAEKVYDVLQEVKTLDEECHIKDRLDKVDEFVMDAHILSSASDVVIKCVSALQLSVSSYDPTEFANKLMEHIKDSDEDEFENKNLLKLMTDARKLIGQVPRYGFLHGAFDPNVLPEPKQRKERKQRTQEPKEKLQKKTLEKIVKVRKEELSVDEIVNHQRKVLDEEFSNTGHKPISYYKFVVDTESFSATVENMFYFSFLIQNGSAAMYIDNDGQPVVKPISKKQKEKSRNEANVQMIASICEDDWKMLQIGEGYLQQRKLHMPIFER